MLTHTFKKVHELQVGQTEKDPHPDKSYSNYKKTKNLESRKKKGVFMYKRYSIQITDDFSTETQEARRQWDGIFKVLKEKRPVN